MAPVNLRFRVAPLRLDPKEIWVGHLVATRYGVVYLEVSRVPVGVTAKVDPRHPPPTLMEIIWSMPEPILGLAFDEASPSLTALSRSGVLVSLAPNLSGGKVAGWAPVARLTLPLTLGLKDWWAFRWGDARYLAVCDGPGTLHLVSVGPSEMRNLGSAEHLGIEFILSEGGGSSPAWANHFKPLSGRQAYLLGLTSMGTLIKVWLGVLAATEGSDQPTGLNWRRRRPYEWRPHPTTSECLSHLNGYGMEAATLKGWEEGLDTQLEITRKSLEFAYRLNAHPELLQVEIQPTLEAVALASSDPPAGPQVQLAVHRESPDHLPTRLVSKRLPDKGDPPVCNGGAGWKV
ncbi:hypothetical protein L0F63_006582 [Massospora cicadina]|nr:hypothetical protein L0F63_006582 [Massospora cicadina]